MTFKLILTHILTTRNPTIDTDNH